jgi:hypothetical protein
MVVIRVLRLGKDTQTKVRLMARSYAVGFFVPMRIIEWRIKEMNGQNVKTRTNCEVSMGLVKDKETYGFKVHDLNLKHNHDIHLLEMLHLIVSQRKISDLQAFKIETTDDSGIGPKAVSYYVAKWVDHLIWATPFLIISLWGKRQREMAYGQAGSMLKYFQDKIVENPSFQYGHKYILKRRFQVYFGLMPKWLLIMHTLVMLFPFALPLEQIGRVDLLVFLLDSTSLEKQ